MQITPAISAIALLPLVLQNVHAGAVNMGAPESGVELGLGWDSQRAEIIPNRCIRFAPVREEGQTIRMQLQEVSDSSELMEQLGVSAGMSIKSALGSASAQGKFASKTKITSSSNSLLIQATVDNGVLFVGPSQPLDPVRSAYPLKEHNSSRPPWWINAANVSPLIGLTDEALDTLGSGDAKNLREFERLCGDSFVSAIYSGAELIAVVSVRSQSRSKAKSAQSCVKAKLSAWGVTGETNACTESGTDQASGSTEVTVDFTQIGGAGGKIPMNQEGFLAKLNDLPAEARTGPQFHSMDLTPYSDLPNWPHAIAMDTTDDPEEALLVNFYYTLTSVQHSLQDALDNPEQYVGEDSAQLKSLQDEVMTYRRDIFHTLQDIHRLAGIPTEVPFLFGLLTRTDAEAVRQKTQLARRLLAQKTRLVAFNGGSENPNLIKLKLPMPCTALESCTGTRCAISGGDIVDYYVGRQSRRICQTDPASSECLNNQQLDTLAESIDGQFQDKLQCQGET